MNLIQACKVERPISKLDTISVFCFTRSRSFIFDGVALQMLHVEDDGISERAVQTFPYTIINFISVVTMYTPLVVVNVGSPIF